MCQVEVKKKKRLKLNKMRRRIQGVQIMKETDLIFFNFNVVKHFVLITSICALLDKIKI